MDATTYNSAISMWFSVIAASIIIGAAFVTGIVMYKETKKMK